MKSFKLFLESQEQVINNPVAKHAMKFAKGAGKHGKSKKAKRRLAKVALQKDVE